MLDERKTKHEMFTLLVWMNIFFATPLLAEEKVLDGILIETTGLADPGGAVWVGSSFGVLGVF